MSQTGETQSIQERVYTITNELYAAGTKPSVRMVLSMLPDVSSTSTVHKYFKQWKDEQEANQQSLYDKLGFSEKFTRHFMEEVTRFGVQAEQRFKEKTLDAEEQRKTAIEDLEKAEERYHQQIALLEQKEKDIKKLDLELSKVQQELTNDLTQAQASHEINLNNAHQQRDDANKKNKELTKSNESLRTEFAKSELKLEGHKALVNEVKANNQMLTKENKELNKELANINKTMAGLESTVAGNKQLIAQIEGGLKKSELAFDKSESERTAVLAERNGLRKDLDTQNSTVSEFKAKLVSADNRIDEYKKTNLEQSSVIKKLTTKS